MRDRRDRGDRREEVSGGLDEPPELQPEQGALRLAGPDDTATRSDWEKSAADVLRRSGRLAADRPDEVVWEALTRSTYDVAVPPLGTRDLAGSPARPRPSRVGGWDVRVRVGGDAVDPVTELERGATSLWVPAALVRAEDLASFLDGVLLQLAPVVLEDPTPAHAQALAAMGPLHAASNLGATHDRDLAPFAHLASDVGVRGIVVDGTGVHEQGASDGQELGWLLARGARVLRILEHEGVAPELALRLVELRVAVTDEQFPAIAKVRALRMLWARLAELCGVPEPRTRIHAVTSRPMTSAYHVHANLLRTTVAAFAAGVGGADAITVVPFDEPTGVVGPLGRRLARNISALLVAESHVARVTDPAGGSYAVERLTDDLCRAGWTELGRIEADGADGEDQFRERVAEVRARREADVAHRRRPLTGLSAYADLADPLPARRNLSYRYGAAFESFRSDPPDAHVFLATLGPVAEHTARARFASDLLAAGGIAADAAGATTGVADLVSAYGGQAVVCLVGSDPAYAAWGSEAAHALRSAGAMRVMVVASGATEGLAWADDPFRDGDDAVAFLGRTREALR
jgi:methylmalonyl-CoA mutase